MMAPNMAGCCEDPTLARVTDLLYGVRQEISELGIQIYNNLCYDIALGPKTRPTIRKLRVFHGALERLRQGLRLRGAMCLSCGEAQHLFEAARLSIRRNCDGSSSLGLKSEGDVAQWAVENPDHIGHEDWEAAMYAVAKKIGFDLELVDRTAACAITYELVKKSLSCEIFADIERLSRDCGIKFNILADERDCDIRYAGVLTKRECRARYKELVKATNCKIAFHDYANILNCGVGADLVGSIYKCGLSVKFSVEEGCPVLVTEAGEELSFQSFSVVQSEKLWNRLAGINIV